MIEQIKNYYENYDEDGRLSRDKAHLPEYLTTIRYFDLLFAPDSQILDACAGAGRYSFYLAEKGHTVTACDLVEHNVNIIKSNPNAGRLADIAACNVLDLSQFQDNSFDVVLCMGALYHLRTNALRERAISECSRVCKQNGIVVLSYITKAGLILANINSEVSNMDELIKTLGDNDEIIFCSSYPHEIENLAVNCGLEKINNIGTDGMIYAVGSKLNNANEEDFQKYMKYHYMMCEDESIIGSSLHGLWFGRKK